MENKIINLLSIKKNVCMSIEEIKKELNMQVKDLNSILLKLENSGVIYKNKSNKYSLVVRTSLKKGVVQMGKKRRPTVVIDGLGSFDLFYNKNNSVENNSVVLVELNTNLGSATVVKVLNSKSDTYIGQIIRKDDKLVIRSKKKEDIVLNKEYPEGVFVVVDSSTNRIREILDSPYEVKIKKMMVKEGVPITYSDAYKRELNDIPEELSKIDKKKALNNGAIDLRNTKHVTLDSDDTKDFDDAFCYENNLLTISIADVPGIIRENSEIEKDAIERGISYYYPGYVNPMFHKKISNGICSLNPGVDRFANSITFRLNRNLGVISYSMNKSIIRSRAKLTYEKANVYLEEGKVPSGYEEYLDMLRDSYEIIAKVKENMIKNGFLMFSSDEVKFLFENEKIINIKGRHHGKAEELIEFLMLLYNMTKTNYMMEHNLPFIARNHDLPNNDKIKAWAMLLRQRGYKVSNKEEFTNEDIKKLLESYREKDEQIVLDKIGIRSQSKARYDGYNKGHFALGLKAYATFTSPIRRLSDYINERVLEDSIKYSDEYAINKWESKIEELAKICTEAEVRSDKIERKAYELKKLEYMSKIKVGTVYNNAIISAVGNSYISVLLPKINIYGKIYINKNNYELSSDRFSLINKVNSERILVGDSIDVSLSKVDMDKEEIILCRSSNIRENNYEEEKEVKKKVKKR